MTSVPFFVGALFACWVLSRLARRFLFRSAPPVSRAIGPNAVALLVATIVGGFGLADGGSPRFVASLSMYVPPALILGMFDLLRTRGGGSRPGADMADGAGE